LTEIHSARISAALKGQPKPPRSAEHSARISAALKGRKNPCSPEKRAQISAKMTGRKNPWATRAIQTPNGRFEQVKDCLTQISQDMMISYGHARRLLAQWRREYPNDYYYVPKNNSGENTTDQ
jgi:hypothetical protein